MLLCEDPVHARSSPTRIRVAAGGVSFRLPAGGESLSDFAKPNLKDRSLENLGIHARLRTERQAVENRKNAVQRRSQDHGDGEIGEPGKAEPLGWRRGARSAMAA